MAVAVTPGQAKPVPLTTSVTRITGIATCREVLITAPAAADVFVVDDQAVADGAALPASYFRVPANAVVAFTLAPGTAYLGLAASAGTPSAHVRPL